MNAAGETLFATGAAKLDDSTPANVVYDSANDNWRHEAQSIFSRSELGLSAVTDNDIAM